MPEDLAVLTYALVGHSATLGGVADQLTTALEAAQAVSMPRDAYGVICQFFPPMIDPLEQRGVDALAASVETMQANVTAVNDTALLYDITDAGNARLFPGERQF